MRMIVDGGIKIFYIMNFENTLKQCLLTYPSIYPNALYVYDHLFLTIGNGYEWKDGTLVSNENYCTNVEDAIVKNINFMLVDNNEVLKRMMTHIDNALEKTVERLIRECVRPSFHIKERMADFTVPDWYDENAPHKDFNKFAFYTLSKYSRLYTMPDDVKNDWLCAAKKMVKILEENMDKVKDPENLLPVIKERINNLYNERYNKLKYLNDIYEITGMDTEEVGSGCHSWFQDVYVCRRISDGYTRTFDSIHDMRLINLNDYKEAI